MFAPLFHAAVLTIAALGFTPRCARETEGESETRIDRIAKGLSESKYSIHDLSRFKGEGPDNLSRFNMPLELGMALSIRYQGKPQERHTIGWRWFRTSSYTKGSSPTWRGSTHRRTTRPREAS